MEGIEVYPYQEGQKLFIFIYSQSQVIKGYVVCKVDKKTSYIHVLCLSKNKYIHNVDMATDRERHR